MYNLSMLQFWLDRVRVFLITWKQVSFEECR